MGKNGNLPGNNGQEHGSDNGKGEDGKDPKPVATTTEPKEPGFFTKIGNWFSNEWNDFWYTPTTRAQRTKKALAIIGIAAAAGGIGYAVGTAHMDSFLDDEDDDFSGGCDDEHEGTFETTFTDEDDEDE